MRPFIALVLFGCSTGTPLSDAGAMDAGKIDAGMTIDPCTGDETRCEGASFERCVDGVFEAESCEFECDVMLGCVDCVPSEGPTCIGNNVRACTDEGLIGEVIEECTEDDPCTAGSCGGCAASTELIYLLDGGAHLFSFDPRTTELVDLGAIDCPSEASPYSMAVDREGNAWVLFDDGNLFVVQIATIECRATAFVPDQDGFHTFGMGFVSDSVGGPETLYIAGGSDLSTAVGNTRLATIDLETLEIDEVGPLTVLDAYYPELSGDGAGGLYGYFPSSMAYPSRVSTVRRDSARIGPTWDTVHVDDGGQISAWAFARWGGAFYLFIEVSSFGMPGDGSEVYRLDPETGELTFVFWNFRAFVGAGVSTCAPILI